tara:strand:+ start:663 stop:1067 length:405 start_codon:yes stop_codon:yes gene_type:complete
MFGLMVAKPSNRNMKSPFFRILAAQSGLTILFASVSLAFSKVVTISIVLAGLSSILPTMFVALVSLQSTTHIGTGLGRVLKGEAGKLVLTIALLTGIFALVEVLSVAAFFGTFIVMQLCQMIVPLLDAQRLMKQ